MSSQISAGPEPKRLKSEKDNDYDHYAMMRERRLCDFAVITKNGKKIPCHRLYLARSPYFAAMFDSCMRETHINESNEDVESELFEPFLEFLYTQKVKKIEELAEKLCVVADRYCCDQLVDLCVSTLTETLNASNAARYLVSCDLINRPTFRNKAIEFISKNLKEVMASESWQKLAENFDIMTEILKIILTSNKAKGFCAVSDLLPPLLNEASNMEAKPGGPENKDQRSSSDHGLKKVNDESGQLFNFNKTVSWRITSENPNAPVKWSPEFTINIGGQNTSFRACVIQNASCIQVFLACTRSITPPPVVVKCTFMQYKAASWCTKLTWDDKDWLPKRVMPDLSKSKLSRFIDIFWYENGGPLVKFEFHFDKVPCSPIRDSSSDLFLCGALKNRRYCDVTIVIEGARFPAHKLVLGERSRFFRILFDAHPFMKELDLTNPNVFLKETLEKNCLSLSTVQNACKMKKAKFTNQFDELLKLVYGHQCGSADLDSLLILHSSALSFLLCASLLHEVEDWIIQNIDVNEACQVLVYARNCGRNRLKTAAFNFVKNNLSAALQCPAWKELSVTPALMTSLIKYLLSLPDMASKNSLHKPEYHGAAAVNAMGRFDMKNTSSLSVNPAAKPDSNHTPEGSTSTATSSASGSSPVVLIPSLKKCMSGLCKNCGSF